MLPLTRQPARYIAPGVCALMLLAAGQVSSQVARPLVRGVEMIDGRRAAAGEVLVRFRGAVPLQALAALGVDSVEPLATSVRRLRSGRPIATLIPALASRADVVYAEPNYLVQIDALPDDPLFFAEAGLFNAIRPGSDIHATAAWDVATGTRGSVVAVVDTGVDYRHPDLVGNLWSAPASFTVIVAGQTITCPAGTIGFDAVHLTCDPLDDHGHGTAMAGLIGAVGNNGIGVAGVNWTVGLMPLKFIRADGLGSYADAIAAIDFAVQVRDIFAASGGAPVRVLSNSWTAPAFSQALLEAIERAGARDMLVVGSAGNDGQDNDLRPVYPASFEAANVLAVLATAVDDSREAFSNFGQRSVDVGAPGLSYSTARGGAYDSISGTSTSAALVSGAASLLVSRCGFGASELKSLLLGTADLVDALRFVSVSGGRINLERAISMCASANQAPVVSLAAPLDLSTFSAAEPIAVVANAFDPDGQVTAVDFYEGVRWVGRDSATPFQITVGVLSGGAHVLTAMATDDRGATTMAPPVTVQVGPSGSSLPAPWDLADIGAAAVSGSAEADGGSFVVTGVGRDIWGTADNFTYVYQRLVGDGSIVARVAALEAADPWTKAGVMIRDALSPDAAHAFMLVSAAKGLAFQRRTSTGSATTHTSAGAGAAPAWVQVSRSGGAVTASVSSDGVSWTVVGTDVISLGDTVLIGLAVTSHTTDRTAQARFDGIALSGPAPHAGALPTGWASQDVGAVGLTGSTTFDGSTFTVSGAGADIWGTADAFHFAYRPLDGDGEIVARLASLDGTASWTKAGVMLRESLDAGAAHAFMLASRAKGAAFQRRLRAGELTVHTGAAGAAPIWVRLVRRGQTVTASLSADGTNWTTVGEDTIAFGATVLAGIAITNHDVGALATGVVGDVTVTPRNASLPPGWSSRDIGGVGTAGSASATGGVFAVTGAGADIWGTQDAFHFAFTTLQANGSVTARVASVDAIHAWTKAGVMIRQSLDAGSAHAFMLVSAGKGLAYQRRPSSGGDTLHAPGGAGTAPYWVQLTRTGSTIMASASADGVSWTVVAVETLDLSGPVYAGLAVSSHDPSRTATAVFTDVRAGP